VAQAAISKASSVSSVSQRRKHEKNGRHQYQAAWRRLNVAAQQHQSAVAAAKVSASMACWRLSGENISAISGGRRGSISG